jgi:hypothetical protein
MNTNLTASNSSTIARRSIKIKTTKKARGAYPYYNPTEILPSECEILHIGEDGEPKQRLIRYVRGMRSIFVDEWSEAERKNKKSKIKLTDGYLTIDTADQNLYNYIMACGHNKANSATRMPDTPVLFEVFDYEATAKKVFEVKEMRTKAENFVANAPLEDVRAYALALCKTKAEAEALKVESEYTVRYKLHRVAEANPEKFIEGLNSSAIKNKVIIHKALNEGIIDIFKNETELNFPESDEPFCVAPAGANVLEWFADLSVNNSDYKAIFEKVKERLSNPVSSEVAEETPWEVQLFNNAIESGKLEKTNNWFSVPDEDGGEPIMKFNGKTNTLKAIKDNEKNILSLIV